MPKRRRTLCYRSKNPRWRLAELRVKVTPKSSRNALVPGDPVKVYVTTAPTDGQANKAVIEVVAANLKVAKSRIEIVRGHTSREKTLVVQDMSTSELVVALSSLE